MHLSDRLERELVLGLDAVEKYAKQGMPREDLEKLMNYAKVSGLAIMFRPVETIAKTLLEEEENPTKSFKIKGKSASWGIWAGFIPVEQRLSKLVSADNDTISKYNAQVQECITSGFATAEQLTISHRRYQELIKNKFIFPQTEKNGYLQIYCYKPDNSDKEICYVREIKEESKYLVFNSKKEPFLVLADVKVKKPLLPDYDLLAVMPRWEKFGQEDIRPNMDITFYNYKKMRPYLSKKSPTEIEKEKELFFSKESDMLGNTSPRIEQEILKINTALGKKPYLERVHHNDDIGSPASCLEANFPITVFLPVAIGEIPNVFLITGYNSFGQILNFLSEEGYYFKLNPLWEKEISYKVSVNFYSNQRYFNFLEIMAKNLTDRGKKLLNSIKNTASFELLYSLLEKTDLTFMSEVIHVLAILGKIDISNGIHHHLLKLFNHLVETDCSPAVIETISGMQRLLVENLLTEVNFYLFIDLIYIIKGNSNELREIVGQLSSLIQSRKLDQIQKSTLVKEFFGIATKSINNDKLDIYKFRTLLKDLKNMWSSQTPEITKHNVDDKKVKLGLRS